MLFDSYKHKPIILSSIMVLSSCSTHINDYQNTTPSFDIKNYFSGNLIAWGLIQDYREQVTRRFCVDLTGLWRGNIGELKETFYYDDGEVSYRNWQLEKLPDGQYKGRAEDVEGTAWGKHQGFAFQWRYNLLLPLGNDTYEFSMDDWMYQMDEYRVFNKTTMSKFGKQLAEITIFFDKEDDSRRCQS